MESMEKHNPCECATTTQEAVKKEERCAPRRAYVPAVDIVENESEIHLIVDIPGVPEGGVDLTVEKNILSLIAVPADGVIAGKRLAYSEYGVGEYRRSFALSDEVNRDSITAALKDGVLRIRLAKTAPVVKKINIACN